MTVSLQTLAAIYYFAKKLAHMDGEIEDEEIQVLYDFFGTFRKMDNTQFHKIFDLADGMDDNKAMELIDCLDDDGKKQVGELFLNVISADGLIDDQEEALFELLKATCNLPASVSDSDAIYHVRLWDPEEENGGTEEEEKVEEEEAESPEEADDEIVPAFLVVNFNGVGTMQQSESEDWSTLGDEIASWIQARRVEVVRFTPPLNAISEKLNLLGRHLVFMIARGYVEDMTVGDNAPASILYGGGGPLYGSVVFALETDGDYEIEGFRTLSLFNQAIQEINEAVDGLIELPTVTFGGQEEETAEEVEEEVEEEEEVWPDEVDGVPYNMDWEKIMEVYDEEEQEVGLFALHGDAASLAKYARMYQEADYYYDTLLEIQDDESEEADEAYEEATALAVEEKYEEAIPLYLKAAKRGHMYAMNALGLCWDAIWNDMDDPDDECRIRAFEWYLKAAVRLHPKACYKLGEAYYNGRVPNEEGFLDSENDYAAAAFWFQQGTLLGDSNSANFLAGMYQDGEGVEQDKVKAVELFQKALEFNPDNTYAQYNMGVCYEKGLGVPVSPEEASKWYFKAKDRYPDAKASYAIIRYNRNPGDSTAIALLKEAANDCSGFARMALDQLGIPY